MDFNNGGQGGERKVYLNFTNLFIFLINFIFLFYRKKIFVLFINKDNLYDDLDKPSDAVYYRPVVSLLADV